MINGETPEQQWNRLQREYQDVLQSAFPNPERQGCPGKGALQDLASRSARHEAIENDTHWKHVIHCAPCYREYLDFRTETRVGAEDQTDRQLQSGSATLPADE